VSKPSVNQRRSAPAAGALKTGFCCPLMGCQILSQQLSLKPIDLGLVEVLLLVLHLFQRLIQRALSLVDLSSLTPGLGQQGHEPGPRRHLFTAEGLPGSESFPELGDALRHLSLCC
jgi:hypothetical protein